ncbi:mechanosensitive ion channel family protein [Kangiella sp. HZ709]|uniref:mechanosensitive ion channel family protein n=1 Tax=Kangiella sp. HZ709 TaxID=2666328 RepID=UPI0012AF785E|nr:mechanosensitive ion channel family protein [Kangiella sp. HZ709]MRX28594.1 mechanosensitive ion channel [Kangiella sp. HZ709]
MWDKFLNSITNNWQGIAWPALTLILGYFIYQLLQRYFLHKEKASNNAVLQRQITSFIFILFLVITFVLVLPIKDSMQSQIIGLIGILLSASIALSSTTFLGNLMAGIWLRSVKNFRVGDFVEIKDHFGRVSARGLLHIEIQNRERDLITLPNMFLVANPVTVMHNDGTIISIEVSLGYDVDHSIIEPILCQAALKAGLDNPYVYIESLGDFSIVYKVHGLAKEINTMLSARSRLNSCVLDALHEANVEIVSPSFMNQRQVSEQMFIPTERIRKTNSKINPEDVIFDKAEKAEKLDDHRKAHRDLLAEISKLKSAIKDESDTANKDQLTARLDKLIAREEKTHRYLKAKEQEINLEGKDK